MTLNSHHLGLISNHLQVFQDRKKTKAFILHVNSQVLITRIILFERFTLEYSHSSQVMSALETKIKGQGSLGNGGNRFDEVSAALQTSPITMGRNQGSLDQ